MYHRAGETFSGAAALPERDRGKHLVRPARKPAQHAARIGVVLWLAQDLAVEHHCRVGAEHELVVR